MGSLVWRMVRRGRCRVRIRCQPTISWMPACPGDNLRGWECPDDQGRRPEKHVCEFIYNSKVRTALGSIRAYNADGHCRVRRRWR